MKQYISDFLDSKDWSVNTRQAYQTDLTQFATVCEGTLSSSKLALYQAYLTDLSPRAQRRKASAVNQFLYFLYENDQVDRYYKVKLQKMTSPKVILPPMIDRSHLLVETAYPAGQLAAVLMGYLGLLPSEIVAIKSCDLDLDFQVLTVSKGAEKRVLSLPDEVVKLIQNYPVGTYLFDKKGQAYTRQWLFVRLSEFTTSIGHREWTAQVLRRSYIQAEQVNGQSSSAIAKSLGRKTTTGIESE